MELIDIVIFICYGGFIVFIGNYLARSKSKQRSTEDYFFANKTLPWYLVGSSVIAANISAEQFIGMSGSGYAIGLAIAVYEWIPALVLIIVAKYFLPIFLNNNILTMPQFLAFRYNDKIKTILAVFWLALFIFVNLSSILYLGALTLQSVFGISMFYGIVGLAAFSLLYTIINGLKAIASTDIVQVFFLFVGGLITTWFAVNKVGGDTGILNGFKELFQMVPEKFHMIIGENDPNYTYLPGIRAVLGGIWIAAIYYFGANQYIIQKAFGAKSLKEAQKGLIFAGYLKLILPFLVVIPGIVVYALNADIVNADEAYPWLLTNIVPVGIQGLIFAALIAAIVSSFSAIINSASTIFTMDLYKLYFKPGATDRQMVFTGRLSSVVFVIISVIVAASLGNFDQAFQFIQEYTGMVSPGITAIFVFGLFWKKTTAQAAFWGTIISFPVSIAIKYFFNTMPFLDQMLVVFFVVAVVIVAISLLSKKEPIPKIETPPSIFKTDTLFNILSLIIIFVFSGIYIIFW